MSNLLLLFLSYFAGLTLDYFSRFLIEGAFPRWADSYTFLLSAVSGVYLYALSIRQAPPLVTLLMCGALIITAITDIRYLLISRYMTLALVPAALFLRAQGVIPGGILGGLCGAFICGGFLWTMGALFFAKKQKEGIGQGDVDLMILIGSYFGLYDAWTILTIASIGGACITFVLHKGMGRSLEAHIPFGTYIAGTALLWLLL